MNIIKFPNQILREKIEDFDFNNPSCDPVQLEKDMIEAMLALDGIGLAANQVGVRARMFVMGHRENPEMAQAFFNPVVLANTEEVEDVEEGCLSFPGVYVKVKRPKKIRVQWHNSKGEIQTDEFDGYNSKCFLHELDHLEGIVFQDRVSTLKWALAVKKTTKNRKFK